MSTPNERHDALRALPRSEHIRRARADVNKGALHYITAHKHFVCLNDVTCYNLSEQIAELTMRLEERLDALANR